MTFLKAHRAFITPDKLCRHNMSQKFSDIDIVVSMSSGNNGIKLNL